MAIDAAGAAEVCAHGHPLAYCVDESGPSVLDGTHPLPMIRRVG